MNLLTGVYLFSALVATVATSKVGDNKSGTATAWDGKTHYSVQSNCPQRPDAAIILVEKSVITQALRADGTQISHPSFDFTAYGFPVRKIIMGVDQNGYGNTINQKCTVRSKSAQVNPKYDKKDSGWWFIESGKLTTVIYDCYNNNNLTCSTSFSEMSAGELPSKFEDGQEQKTPSHTDNSREE